MRNDSEEKIKRAKKVLLDQAKRAVAVRSKDREFHGLQREFMYLQAEMLVAYEKSKDMKHPRDLGDTREEILRKFLLQSRYLPERYRVSQGRARVASTTGHMTGEMDIVIYDPYDTICLMSREGVYEVYPVETVYGVIQVKSRLNKGEIGKGLENIASFKKLVRSRVSSAHGETQGFGLLFAYDTTLQASEIVAEVEEFSRQNPASTWANGIFVLSEGCVIHGDARAVAYQNSAMRAVSSLMVHHFPDQQQSCLYQFYRMLMELLRATAVQAPSVDSYFRLPLTANEHSYEFCYGSFHEVDACPKHGDYQRKIEPDQLARVIDWCKSAEPMNWVRVTDIAYGRPDDNVAAYERNPGDVRVYNPDELPFSDVLLADTVLHDSEKRTEYHVKGLAFDAIQSGGMVIYIPHYYSIKEGVIGGCPKCATGDPAT